MRSEVQIFPDPPLTWGHSSAGRAPALHAGGGRFDPAWLHQVSSRAVVAEKKFLSSRVNDWTLLFNNLDIKFLMSCSGLALLCLYISSVAFAQLLNIGRLAQPIGRANKLRAQKERSEFVSYPRMFWVIWSSD